MYQRKKNLKNLVVSFHFFSVAHISYLACVFTNFFWRFFSFGAFSCHLICGHEAARAAVLAADGHLALLGVLCGGGDRSEEERSVGADADAARGMSSRTQVASALMV